MVEIQSYHYTKMLDNDKKRPPLLDISNKHQATKKQKQEALEDGCGSRLGGQFMTITLANPFVAKKSDRVIEQDVGHSLVSKLSLLACEIPSPHKLKGGAVPKASFSSIPVETVMCILSFLPSCADVLTARLVCKDWDKFLRERCLRKCIYQDDFLRQTEECYRVTGNYMKPHFQKEINPHMRTILVDWLVEVADEFQFHPETIFLCVNYLDRYLSVQQVPRSKLQLVGGVCLLIAAKFEEIQVPRVEEFVFISDNTCTREEVFTMEVHVLAKLKYFLAAATSRAFLNKYLTAISVPEHNMIAVDTLSNFFIELALLEHDMLKYPASLVAASALCLALQTLNFSAWTHTLEHFTQYSITDKEMQECVAMLHVLFVHCPIAEFKAVYKKYQERCVFNVFPVPPLTLPRLSSTIFIAPGGAMP